jgi:hypothetical protein
MFTSCFFALYYIILFSLFWANGENSMDSGEKNLGFFIFLQKRCRYIKKYDVSAPFRPYNGKYIWSPTIQSFVISILQKLFPTIISLLSSLFHLSNAHPFIKITTTKDNSFP